MRSYEIKWLYNQLNWEYFMGYRTNMFFLWKQFGVRTQLPRSENGFCISIILMAVWKNTQCTSGFRDVFFVFRIQVVRIPKNIVFSHCNGFFFSQRSGCRDGYDANRLPCLRKWKHKGAIIPAFCRWMYSFRISWGKTTQKKQWEFQDPKISGSLYRPYIW